jgi:hypothetical protein
VNEIDIRVARKGNGDLAELGKEGQQAGKKIGDGLREGFKDAEQSSGRAHKKIGDDLDRTERKARESGSAAGKALGDGLGDGVKDVLSGGGIEDALGGLLDNVKGAGGPAIAAGVGLGALLMQGMAQEVEEQKIGGLLAAQTGAAMGAAGQLGHTAGEIFGDNFGESIAEVGEAMKAVFQNRLIDKSANEADIKAVTETAMTAAQVVGEDVNSIARAAQQLVRTGLAGSVSEALDMITHASQEGLNVSEDLLDTITEYSTKFRDLGLNGQEAFGLVSQAVAAGARDTDTAADALKEFAIRAQDGSATTSRGFQTIGLDAKIMGDMIAAGGNSAKDALGQTLDQLRRIENPIVRDQAAVDLFGTKAEDLGDALFAMDLDTATRKFGAFAGAAKEAADKIAGAAPAVETAWRNIQAGVNNSLDFLTQSDDIDAIQAKVREVAGAAGAAQAEHAAAVDAAANAWRNQGKAIGRVTDTLDEYISKTHEMASGVLDLSAAQIGYQKALDDSAESAKENKKNLDINTEAGRNNRESLNDLASETYDVIAAMEQQGATAAEIAAFMGGARDSFIATAVSMGMAAPKAAELADKLHLIPGDYVARVYTPGAAESDNVVRTLHGHLVDLTNRSWIASVAVSGTSGGRYFAGLAHGGVVPGHAAEGGPRGNRVLVGEHGPEIADLAPGSTVHSNPDSMRMMRGMGGGGEVRVVFDFRNAGGGVESAIVECIRKAVQVQGGNVQTVLGP